MKKLLSERKYKILKKIQKIGWISFAILIIPLLIYFANWEPIYDELWYNDLESLFVVFALILYIPWMLAFIFAIVATFMVLPHEKQLNRIAMYNKIVEIKNDITNKFVEFGYTQDLKSFDNRFPITNGDMYIYDKILVISNININFIDQISSLEIDAVLDNADFARRLEYLHRKYFGEMSYAIGLADEMIVRIEANECTPKSTTKKMGALEYRMKSDLVGEGYALAKYLEREEKIKEEKSEVEYYIAIKMKSGDVYTTGISAGFKLRELFPLKCGISVKLKLEKKYNIKL